MKKITFLLIAFMASAMVNGQGVDLSGKWKLNDSKSKLNAEFSMAPKELIIIQSGIDLSMERHSDFQGQEFVSNDKFTLDGQECKNVGFMDSEKKSTAVWSGDKSSLKITSKINMGDGGEMVTVEVLKFDGDNLVIESSSSSPFGDMSETMVYNK